MNRTLHLIFGHKMDYDALLTKEFSEDFDAQHCLAMPKADLGQKHCLSFYAWLNSGLNELAFALLGDAESRKTSLLTRTSRWAFFLMVCAAHEQGLSTERSKQLFGVVGRPVHLRDGGAVGLIDALRTWEAHLEALTTFLYPVRERYEIYDILGVGDSLNEPFSISACIARLWYAYNPRLTNIVHKNEMAEKLIVTMSQIIPTLAIYVTDTTERFLDNILKGVYGPIRSLSVYTHGSFNEKASYSEEVAIDLLSSTWAKQSYANEGKPKFLYSRRLGDVSAETLDKHRAALLASLNYEVKNENKEDRKSVV